MARESQGLQITLIVLVILVIALMVSTFALYKQSSARLIKATAAEEAAGKAQADLLKTLGEFNQVKGFVGLADETAFQDIQTAFTGDMVGVDETSKSYRKTLEASRRVLETKSAELAAEQKTVQDLKNSNLALEAAKQTQIEAAETRAKKAETDLAAQTAKFTADRAAGTQREAGLQAQLDAVRKDTAAQLAKSDEEKKKLAGDRDTAMRIAESRNIQLETVLSEKFEVADGKVRWVNQREGAVYVDLGSADGLSRLTTFSVYSSGTNDVSDAKKKGAVEVTRLLGEHLAEARIVEDDVSDPIMPGDLVNTSVWSPGQREHIGLTSGMDLNGDEKSDMEAVRNLVALGGGVVDAYIDDAGNLQGQITPSTRFLVLGNEPQVNASAEQWKSWSKLTDDAKKFGVRIITLTELLNRVGWKQDTRVVTFGRGANPSDFQLGPPGGIERVSRGEVSESFRERRPAQPRITTY